MSILFPEHRIVPSLLTCLLLAQAPSLRAQEEPGAVGSFGEEVTVDVVNVEAWVTDRKGQPVTDLTADDFELLVDGEPVEIGYFAAFTGEAADRTGAAASPEREEEWQRVPAAREPNRVVVFVDDWNLRPEDRARVLDDLRSFLDRQLRPGEQAMVLVHNGAAISIAQELTVDREALGRSLDRVEATSTAAVQLEFERRQALRGVERAVESAEAAVQALARRGAEAAVGDLDICNSAWPDIAAEYRNYAAGVAGHARASASGLATAVQSLAGLPGSKVMIYVGNGLPDQPGVDVIEYLRHVCPHLQTEAASLTWDYDLNPLYDQVIERANANRVTLYMLEAEGPDAPLDTGPTELRYRIPAQAQAMREISLEAGLSRMAEETGGRAILDSGDFARAFDGIDRDLRNYYSLGFVPETPGDAGQHRLEVRLRDRKGYRVRHRSSYRDKPFEQRMMERVYAVAGLAGESNPLGVRVEAGEGTAGVGGEVNVPLRIWAPLDAISLVPGDEEGGGSVGRLRVMMTVTQAGGAAGPIRQKMVPVEVPAEVEAAGEAGPEATHREKLVEVNLGLLPGRHVVGLGVRDELGGEISFLRHEIEVDALAVASGDR